VASAAGDAAESRRDVAAAVLTLQGIEWRARVSKAIELIDAQAVEFDAQLQHLKETGSLPREMQRVAVEQLLDAVGAITVTVQGILLQAEHEMSTNGWLTVDMKSMLFFELRRLPPALAAVQRWGLEIPSELLSIDGIELRSIPLAATDPKAGVGVRATVQRVLGALLVANSETALKHIAWVDFDDFGEPVFSENKQSCRPTIFRPPAAAAGSVCARIDAALHIYGIRANAATSKLVPAVRGDLHAYSSAKAAALAEPGANVAIAELKMFTKQVPQMCGPRDENASVHD
jgi:hypothetical protein